METGRRCVRGLAARWAIVLVALLTLPAGPAWGQCAIDELTAWDAGDHNFGFRADIDGEVIVVGSPAYSSNAGSAFIFRYDGTSWVQDHAVVEGSGTNWFLGWGVAVKDDTLLIGVPGRPHYSVPGVTGVVLVYRNVDGAWALHSTIWNPGQQNSKEFGYSVAMRDRDTIVIGAPGDNWNGTASGSTWVYGYNSGTYQWEQLAGGPLHAPDGVNGDQAGVAVAIDGNRIVSGAYGDDDFGPTSGSGYVFTFDDDSYSVEKLPRSYGDDMDQYGLNVGIAGNTIVVGSFGDHYYDHNSGAAYIYEYEFGAWVEKQILRRADAEAGDCFGLAVAIDGDNILVGAYGYDTPVYGCGAAFLYRRVGGTWIEDGILTAPVPEENDFFGQTVALDGDIAVAGASYQDLQGGADEVHVFAGISDLDCNNNGEPDGCDIRDGYSEDCNGNFVPDECDIDSTFSADDNLNGVPDECEPVYNATQGTLHLTIQEAIDAASPNDVITIRSGTYEEQLEITIPLTLTGQAQDTTVIQSPVALIEGFVFDGPPDYPYLPIVYVHDTDGVTIRNLTVDGLSRGIGNYHFLGIAFWNAGGKVIECMVKNMQDDPLSSQDHGVGIYAGNDLGGPHTVEVVRTKLEDYQAGGISLTGASLTAHVRDCNVYGEGSTDVVAQTGIELADGATGAIDGGLVLDHRYTPGAAASPGIRLADCAGTVVVKDATLDRNRPGALCQNSDAVFDMARVSSGIDSGDGVYVCSTSGSFGPMDSAPAIAAFLLEQTQTHGPRAEMNVSVLNSPLWGGQDPGRGVYAEATGTDSVNLWLSNTFAHQWDYGVYASDDGQPVFITARSCAFDGNAPYGFYSESGSVDAQDARYNWWGDVSGPYDPDDNQGGLGAPVSGDNVDYDPWSGGSAGLSLTSPIGADWCSLNATVLVYVDLYSASSTVTSGDFFLSYDDSVLQFEEINPGDSPFTKEYYVDQGPGWIDYTSGIELGGAGATSGRMAIIRFTTIAEADSASSLVTFRRHDPPTQLTGDGTTSIAVSTVPLGSRTIDVTAPTIICPVEGHVQCIEDIPDAAGNLNEFLALQNSAVWDNSSNPNMSEITIDFMGQVSDGQSCPETITRTYRATDECGNVAECTHDIVVWDTIPPEIHDMPADITVNADAGGCTAVVTWAEPDATDNCNCGVFSFTSDYGPGDTFPQGDTLVSYTAEDCCGNSTMESFWVTVLPFNDVVLSLGLEQIDEPALTRCITFEVFEDPNTRYEVERDVTFTTGVATNVTVEVPCGNWQCITARDKLHTLRRTLVRDDNDDLFKVENTYYVADFVTAAKPLIGGNLNDMYDQWIDVLDFGIFISEWNSDYGSGDTPCGTLPYHADVTGDGQVTTADFTYIQTHYLSQHEADCYGGWASPLYQGDGFQSTSAGPVRRISLNELSNIGMGDLATADLNGDGWLDENDIVLFIEGVRPASRRR